jgi:hypothetical protein
MVVKILSTVLHYANANPPFLAEREFYAIKDRLLEQYGQPDGHDVQRIEYACWNCDGSTWCNKCGGTGIYNEKWIMLERFNFGRFQFHRPVPEFKFWPKLKGLPTIEGKVQHANYGRLSDECALWLFLLFDRVTFWPLMRWRCKIHPGFYPLLNIQKACFYLTHLEMSQWFKWVQSYQRKVKLLKQHQCECGRHYRPILTGEYFCNHCIAIGNNIPF